MWYKVINTRKIVSSPNFAPPFNMKACDLSLPKYQSYWSLALSAISNLKDTLVSRTHPVDTISVLFLAWPSAFPDHGKYTGSNHESSLLHLVEYQAGLLAEKNTHRRRQLEISKLHAKWIFSADYDYSPAGSNVQSNDAFLFHNGCSFALQPGDFSIFP